ncbi:MAG: hypothetical protein AB8B93_10435 [Pseudomonadales bacterium]
MALDQFTHLNTTFDKHGQRVDQDPVAALTRLLEQTAGAPFTDLLVLSHGWNNNARQAREFYDDLLQSLLQVARDQGQVLPDSLAVLALHWPSKQFDFERRRGAGGAASIAANDRAADQASVLAALEDLRDFAESDAQHNSIDIAGAMVPELDDLRSARDAFVATLLPLLTEPNHGDAGDAPESLLARLTGREVLDKLDRPPPPGLAPRPDDATGGLAGGATGRVAAGAQRGAFSFINLLTFWKMKARAGKVGQRGVAALLDEIARTRPQLSMHLAGHSFGARLLTAAAMAVSEQTRLASLSLLQGAFSHHAFAGNLTNNADEPRSGAFRKVITAGKVDGPILATHTRNDRAVGLAYPMAARLSRDDAAALGDAQSRFGGIGSNGAVRTEEAQFLALGPVGSTYPFEANHIFNLQADAFIDGHSDITGPEVAHALLAAIHAKESN